MAEQSTSQFIENSLNQRIETARSQQDVHLERIIVLDDAKNSYMTALRQIDGVLLNELQKVNDSIQAVNDAYQNRINFGCRTDLFWRLTDVEVDPGGSIGGRITSPPNISYTYMCTRLSSSGYPSVGVPPPPKFTGFFGNITPSPSVRLAESLGISGVSTTTVEYVSDDNGTHLSVPLDSVFGLRPQNLYGLKMYDEPYTKDIGDTFITSFIGTCGVGTNVVIAMIPNISGGLPEITPGQLLTCSKPNVFNSDAYVITGVSTALTNLSGINTQSPSQSTEDIVVPKFILDDNTLIPCYAPEDNGNYVTFTVLDDPDNFGDLSLSKETSPYVPQTIKCPMDFSDVGKGVRIEFDNSGSASGTSTWNQYLEGQTDPNANIRGNSEAEIRRLISENIVREPKIGAGKLFHRLGFEFAPVIYTDAQRTQYRFAKEGEVVVLQDNRMGQGGTSRGRTFFGSIFGPSAGVIRLPSCSSDVDNLVRETERISSEAIAGLSSATTQNNIEIANMLRDDLSDINIRIWSERQLLGDAIERQGTYAKRLTDVNNNRTLIDGE
jgi:hypothetical protein